MRWYNVQTNDYDLQDKTYPIMSANDNFMARFRVMCISKYVSFSTTNARLVKNVYIDCILA